MRPHALRLGLVIGLAAALTKALAGGIDLSSEAVAYGVVIATLVIRPDFNRWPTALYPVLVVLTGLAMGIGLAVAMAFPAAPSSFSFAVVAALMQLLGLMLPAKLQLLRGALAVAGVLPLLSSGATPGSWAQELGAIVLGLVIGTLLQVLFTPALVTPAPEPEEPPPDPPLAVRLSQGWRSPFFWQRTLLAMLALAIGEGIGAVTPKYLYFGVVLLLNDTLDATLARVIDRMVGVSLGVLMPLLVFNTMGMGSLQIGLVMGGTATLVLALGLGSFLRTALISSGVAFAGYGPLVAWYIPNRWIDYLMGCLLAAAAALLSEGFRRQQQQRPQQQAASRRPAPACPSPQGRDRWHG